MIRYGHFLQFVWSVDGGHVSIGLELDQNPLQLEPAIAQVLEAHGLLAPSRRR